MAAVATDEAAVAAVANMAAATSAAGGISTSVFGTAAHTVTLFPASVFRSALGGGDGAGVAVAEGMASSICMIAEYVFRRIFHGSSIKSCYRLHCSLHIMTDFVFLVLCISRVSPICVVSIYHHFLLSFACVVVPHLPSPLICLLIALSSHHARTHTHIYTYIRSLRPSIAQTSLRSRPPASAPSSTSRSCATTMRARAVCSAPCCDRWPWAVGISITRQWNLIRCVF